MRGTRRKRHHAARRVVTAISIRGGRRSTNWRAQPARRRRRGTDCRILDKERGRPDRCAAAQCSIGDGADGKSLGINERRPVYEPIDGLNGSGFLGRVPVMPFRCSPLCSLPPPPAPATRFRGAYMHAVLSPRDPVRLSERTGTRARAMTAALGQKSLRRFLHSCFSLSVPWLSAAYPI